MNRRIVIGTDDRSDLIIVDEPHVSLRHCEIWRDASRRMLVQDLGSTNGTWLVMPSGGRHRVYGPVQVFPGSVLWLGADVALSWERLEALLQYGFEL